MTWHLPAVGRVTSPFGPRVLTGAVGTFHYGTDLGSKRGPVYAAALGTVRALWRTPLGAWVLDIQHQGDIRTRYIHMHREDITVDVGDKVKAGHVVGRSGASGTVAAHLHFEVLVRGVNVDPEPFMAARGVPLGQLELVTNPGPSTPAVPTAPDLTSPDTLTPEDDMAGIVDDPKVQAALKGLVMEALVETDLAVATRAEQFGRNAQDAALARARVEAHHVLTGAAGGATATFRQIRAAIATLTHTPATDVVRDLDDEALAELARQVAALPDAINDELDRRAAARAQTAV